jgi:predicted RNase H-like HicB family nuclease
VTIDRVKVLVRWDSKDAVWVTYVPELDDLSTYGETKAEALEKTREAVLGYLEAAAKEGIQLTAGSPEPELIDLDVATV